MELYQKLLSGLTLTLKTSIYIICTSSMWCVWLSEYIILSFHVMTEGSLKHFLDMKTISITTIPIPTIHIYLLTVSIEMTVHLSFTIQFI